MLRCRFLAGLLVVPPHAPQPDVYGLCHATPMISPSTTLTHTPSHHQRFLIIIWAFPAEIYVSFSTHVYHPKTCPTAMVMRPSAQPHPHLNHCNDSGCGMVWQGRYTSFSWGAQVLDTESVGHLKCHSSSAWIPWPRITESCKCHCDLDGCGPT
jgi:hypothetical protein